MNGSNGSIRSLQGWSQWTVSGLEPKYDSTLNDDWRWNFLTSVFISARYTREMRLARTIRRTLRAWRPEAWLAMLLLVFTSSEYVLSAPGMLAGMPSHAIHQHSDSGQSESSQSELVRVELKGAPVNVPKHDHKSCQLCMAPPLATAVTDNSQLGKTRLELLEVILDFGIEHGTSPTIRFVLSRAPPVS
jgi:hypothetical protein